MTPTIWRSGPWISTSVSKMWAPIAESAVVQLFGGSSVPGSSPCPTTQVSFTVVAAAPSSPVRELLSEEGGAAGWQAAASSPANSQARHVYRRVPGRCGASLMLDLLRLDR